MEMGICCHGKGGGGILECRSLVIYSLILWDCYIIFMCEKELKKLVLVSDWLVLFLAKKYVTPT